MDVEVTVRNCRCFSDTPVRFALKKGLQAFVGVNNSGKSSLLRLFYELRRVFEALSHFAGVWNALTSPQQTYTVMPLVKDQSEIFCDRNDRDIVITFEMNLPTVPCRLEIVIKRGTYQWSAKLYASGGLVPTTNVATRNEGPGPDDVIVYSPTSGDIVSLRPVADLGKALT